MLTAQEFELNNLRLYAEVGPPGGQPLVLLHGVSRAGGDFSPLFATLSQRWRIISMDHRGHGRSGRAESYFVRDYAVDAAEVISRGSFHPAVLYGHSLGALVALQVAAAQPELVRAIILEDPPAPRLLADIERTSYYPLFSAMKKLAGSQLPASELARVLGETRLPTAQGEVRLKDLRDGVSLRLVARFLKEVDPAVYDPLLAGRWLEGIDWFATLKAVRCPVLLLSADEKAGGMLSRMATDEMITYLTDVIHLQLPGIGHLIHWQATETCLRHVLGFLESLRT